VAKALRNMTSEKMARVKNMKSLRT